MIQKIKEFGAIANGLLSFMLIKFWLGNQLKECTDIVKELDTINPNWVEDSPKNTEEYLKLLKEIYLLGCKPGELHKLLKILK